MDKICDTGFMILIHIQNSLARCGEMEKDSEKIDF